MHFDCNPTRSRGLIIETWPFAGSIASGMQTATTYGERRRRAKIMRLRTVTVRLLLWLLCVLGSSCNALFDISPGALAACRDEFQIDDFEDGDDKPCLQGGRNGEWWVDHDGSPGSTLSLPLGSSPVNPTRLPPGERESSQYALHFSGTGHRDWGAVVGTSLAEDGPYNALKYDGIQFWLKADVPLSVVLPTLQTVKKGDGGECEGTDNKNCDNHHAFHITKPKAGWAQYQVPFNALGQALAGGSAEWGPEVVGVQFLVHATESFDVWIDDVQFYQCGTECKPTCTDDTLPVSCPKGQTYHSGCKPAGTDCSKVTDKCSDNMVVDDFEDGDERLCNSTDGRNGSWRVEFPDESRASHPMAPSVASNSGKTNGKEGQYALHLTPSLWSEKGTAVVGELDAASMSGGGYNAHDWGGLSLQLKSNNPTKLFVFPVEALDVEHGGTCDSESNPCNSSFSYSLPATQNTWQDVRVPFSALKPQFFDEEGNLHMGSVDWDPSHLRQLVFFIYQPNTDVWIDDIRFFRCDDAEQCLPMCDGYRSQACPALEEYNIPADCWPSGTDCQDLPVLLNYGIWGFASDDVWAVGLDVAKGGANISHFDGTRWTSSVREDVPTLWAILGNDAGELWAMGDRGTVLSGTSKEGLVSMSPSVSDSSIRSAWGQQLESTWVTLNKGVRRLVETSGVSVEPFLPDTALAAIWGSAPDNIWAAGEKGNLAHWTGADWSVEESPTTSDLYGLWGSAADDIWAVGESGTALHFQGGVWEVIPTPTDWALLNVWGSSAQDVWAIGDGGTILHWDGSNWSTVSSPTPFPLSAIWGSAADDIWAAGEFSPFIHFDGNEWLVTP